MQILITAWDNSNHFLYDAGGYSVVLLIGIRCYVAHTLGKPDYNCRTCELNKNFMTVRDPGRAMRHNGTMHELHIHNYCAGNLIHIVNFEYQALKSYVLKLQAVAWSIISQLS